MTDSSNIMSLRGFPPWRVVHPQPWREAKSALSRRSLVSAAVALPALAVPALALAAPDPIFAAIERYKAAVSEHVKSCDGEPRLRSPRYEAWREAQLTLFSFLFGVP